MRDDTLVGAILVLPLDVSNGFMCAAFADALVVRHILGIDDLVCLANRLRHLTRRSSGPVHLDRAMLASRHLKGQLTLLKSLKKTFKVKSSSRYYLDLSCAWLDFLHGCRDFLLVILFLLILFHLSLIPLLVFLVAFSVHSLAVLTEGRPHGGHDLRDVTELGLWVVSLYRRLVEKI